VPLGAGWSTARFGRTTKPAAAEPFPLPIHSGDSRASTGMAGLAMLPPSGLPADPRLDDLDRREHWCGSVMALSYVGSHSARGIYAAAQPAVPHSHDRRVFHCHSAIMTAVAGCTRP